MATCMVTQFDWLLVVSVILVWLVRLFIANFNYDELVFQVA